MAKLIHQSNTWKCSNCNHLYTVAELSEAFDNQFFDVEGQLSLSNKNLYTSGRCVECKKELTEVENI